MSSTPETEDDALLEELTLHLQDLDDRPDITDSRKYAAVFLQEVEELGAARAITELCIRMAKGEPTITLSFLLVLANTASAVGVPDEQWLPIRALVPGEDWIALREHNEERLDTVLDALKEVDTAKALDQGDYDAARNAYFEKQMVPGLETLVDRIVEAQVKLSPWVLGQLVALLEDWRVDRTYSEKLEPLLAD